MKIIAHRGNDGTYRENSKKSILSSLNKEYIDGVEFDIRLTKDNRFIINHDPFYYDYFIKNTNSKTLIKKGLDTLDDVLNMIDNKKIILIEVKEEDKNIKKTAKKLYQILSRYKLNIYVCSFNYNFIKYFKDNYNIKSGVIIGKHINTKYIVNNFDFNLVSYKYKGKLPDKETFIWTVNKIDEIKNKNENIITDKAKEIYKYISETKS